MKRSRRPVAKPGRIHVWTFGEMVAAYAQGAREFQLLRTMRPEQDATLEHCTFYVGAEMHAFFTCIDGPKVNIFHCMFDGQNGRNGAVKFVVDCRETTPKQEERVRSGYTTMGDGSELR